MTAKTKSPIRKPSTGNRSGTSKKDGCGKHTRPDGKEECFLSRAEMDQMEIIGLNSQVLIEETKNIQNQIEKNTLLVQKIQLESQLQGVKLNEKKAEIEKQKKESLDYLDKIREQYGLKPGAKFRFDPLSGKIIEE
jgi:hypothetical protein